MRARARYRARAYCRAADSSASANDRARTGAADDCRAHIRAGSADHRARASHHCTNQRV